MPKRQRLSAKDFKLVSPDEEAGEPARARVRRPPRSKAKADAASGPVDTEDSRERLYAFPERDANVGRADLTGQLDALLAERLPGYDSFKAVRSPASCASTARRWRWRPCTRAPRSSPAPCSAASARRPSSPRTSTSRSADGPRRAEDRPEADPGRLEAARGDRDLPRRRQEPVRGLGRLGRPDPPDVEGAAGPAHARRPAARDLLVRPRGHPDRPDRPPHHGAARVPDGARLPPDDHLAQVRARRLHGVRQHQPALVRRRGRHRPDQRPARARQPGPGLDLRGARQGHACRCRGP